MRRCEAIFSVRFSSSYTNMNFHFLSHRFFEYISLFPPLEHRTMGFRLLAFLRLPLLTVRWKYRFSVVFPSTSTPFPARHLRVLFCHRQEHEKRSKKKRKRSWMDILCRAYFLSPPAAARAILLSTYPNKTSANMRRDFNFPSLRQHDC